eukprot:2772094-Pleurochrysis_carterae.AAC.1
MAAPKAATFRRIDSIAQVEIWCGWHVGWCLFGERARGCVSPGARAASVVHAWDRALCATSLADRSNRRRSPRERWLVRTGMRCPP